MKMMPTPSRTILIALATLWVLIAVWQVEEHKRVRDSAQQMLLNHASDIATSLEVILQSQARFAAVSRDRLEAALQALSKSSELLSLALINPGGKVVTSGGEPPPADAGRLAPGTHWSKNTLTVIDLIELPLARSETAKPAERGSSGLLMLERFPGHRSFRAGRRRENRNRRNPNGPETKTPGQGTGTPPGTPAAPTGAPARPANGATPSPPEPHPSAHTPSPPGPAGATPSAAGRPRRVGERWVRRPLAEMTPQERADYEAHQRFRQWMREHGRYGEHPRYPPWLTKRQFQELYDKYGLQRFLLTLSAGEVQSQIERDLWERTGLVLAALLAVCAIWFGWQSLQRATGLSLRLVRAHEMNTHLREMNTAAAGLAHETRNPLNSVRGLAQLIFTDPAGSAESRTRARTVMAEVDRINSRLGEFLAYSRPKPPNPASVDLGVLVDDVVRTLDTDREEKQLAIHVEVRDVRVMADESQFRQVLFNLILNACQASPPKGTVSIVAQALPGELVLRVRDQGPGVPEELREDIFRPYFTLNEQGTGLGLAVTRQIVLAHHWEIACLAPPEGGAEFRVSGIRMAGKNADA